MRFSEEDLEVLTKAVAEIREDIPDDWQDLDPAVLLSK